MATTRSTLIGGAANFTHSGYTSALAGDGRFDLQGEWSDVNSAMFGLIDQVNSDLLIKISGSPLTFDPHSTPAALYPYLTPSFGAILPGDADTPFAFFAANGDVYTAVCAVLTKMPDLTLGVNDPAMGPAEWTGIIGNGLEPENAGAYYKIETGQTFTPSSIDRTKIPRGQYSLSWNFTSGGTSLTFYPEDKLVVSFETTLEPIQVQGRTRGFKLAKLAVMTKLIPVGLTATQITAAIKLQGAGATHGHRLSSVSNDLTISGPMNIVQKNAAVKTAGFRFGNTVLRPGEIGFYSTVDPTTGTIGPILTFS